ncbi:MAG: DUF3800 domain-containing protein [Actinobacteria bacterium]|nr:DUF3800 domain-containing protein [Actinomycetota bacterium]
MHLLYVDESGKSGPRDYTQPWYVLGGLILPEEKWKAAERDLNEAIDAVVPPPRSDDWELHMTLIAHRKKHFSSMPEADRFSLVDAVFDVMEWHDLKLIFVAIDKEKHQKKYARPDPVERFAYMLMLERFNYCAGRQNAIGLVVADEQKEVELSTRKAHSRYRRDGTGMSRIDHVIETPFFTPSHWSRPLQMIDVATYYVARHLRGATTASYWERIERRLDGYPDYEGKGLKTFP